MDFTGYTDAQVALGVGLVNTYDPVDGTEELADPEAVRTLLRTHGSSYGGRITQADVRELHAVRERLREVFTVNDEHRASELLNRLLADAGPLPQLTDHDGEPWHLHYTPAATPIARRVAAEAAMGLAVTIALHGFDRLHVCEGEDCEAVFVDTSRNRSRRYCSPKVCGNRASVAAFRARLRQMAGTGGT